MANLFIVPSSLQRFGDASENQVNTFIGSLPEAARAGAVLLHPAALKFDGTLFSEMIPYDAGIGLEKNPQTWRPLLRTYFAGIFIIGSELRVDYEEIVLACYLNGFRKRYIDGDGAHDLATCQTQVRPSLSQRPVRIRRLDETKQREYFRTVHRWVAAELSKADFDFPVPIVARSPEFLIYRRPWLSMDLAQLTDELQREAFGMSFSTLRCLGGSLVHSSDFYRSIANFIGAIDGMKTVLDVGCGSGFLVCHLAASGRYEDVLGIDASPERVDGARLHAELNGSAARFENISMSDIRLPDKSVDMAVTSFALEQSGEHLERCLAEIRRVTRKLIVLVEPSNDFFGTLPSMWQVPASGWANQYHDVLVKSGLAYAMRPNLLSHYFNPGTIFVIDLECKEHPRIRYPQLFGIGVEDWPGGVATI
jgi:SAM-dependent methyltransferase